MMFNLILVLHKDITSRQLEDIIRIKSIAWPYSFERQLEWIDKNLKESDIHVLLSLNETNIAYLNLIDIELELDGFVNGGFGIGNVCSIKKGKGWGKELITRTNNYLTQNNKIGLLFCRDNLTNFYSLNKWKIIEKRKLQLSFDNNSVETMIFNCVKEFHNLKYIGKTF